MVLDKSGFALLLDSVQLPGYSLLLMNMRQPFRCQGTCTRAHPPENSVVHAFVVKVHTNSRVQEALLLILALPGPFSPINNTDIAFWISNLPCLQQEQGSWFDDVDVWGAEVRQGIKRGQGARARGFMLMLPRAHSPQTALQHQNIQSERLFPCR